MLARRLTELRKRLDALHQPEPTPGSWRGWGLGRKAKGPEDLSMPVLTALENVAMPLLVRRMPVSQARERSYALLARVGLKDRVDHKPHQLSGGERQRAAVARALVTEPRIVLADEPTGNLDGANAEQVFTLMLELNQERGTSLVVVTHDLRLARRMGRTLELERGILREAEFSGA